MLGRRSRARSCSCFCCSARSRRASVRCCCTSRDCSAILRQSRSSWRSCLDGCADLLNPRAIRVSFILRFSFFSELGNFTQLGLSVNFQLLSACQCCAWIGIPSAGCADPTCKRPAAPHSLGGEVCEEVRPTRTDSGSTAPAAQSVCGGACCCRADEPCWMCWWIFNDKGSRLRGYRMRDLDMTSGVYRLPSVLKRTKRSFPGGRKTGYLRPMRTS